MLSFVVWFLAHPWVWSLFVLTIMWLLSLYCCIYLLQGSCQKFEPPWLLCISLCNVFCHVLCNFTPVKDKLNIYVCSPWFHNGWQWLFSHLSLHCVTSSIWCLQWFLTSLLLNFVFFHFHMSTCWDESKQIVEMTCWWLCFIRHCWLMMFLVHTVSICALVLLNRINIIVHLLITSSVI